MVSIMFPAKLVTTRYIHQSVSRLIYKAILHFSLSKIIFISYWPCKCILLNSAVVKLSAEVSSPCAS